MEGMKSNTILYIFKIAKAQRAVESILDLTR